MRLRIPVLAGTVWLYAGICAPPASAQISIGIPGAPPARYNPTASLRLQVTPRDTQVFIDGYYAGIVDDFDGTFQRLDVEAGQHALQLFLPGYRLHAEQIYLQPGNTFKVKYTMERLRPGEPEPERPSGAPRASGPPPGRAGAPLPQGQQPPTQAVPPVSRPAGGEGSQDRAGSVTIRVQPADAQILIDGERWDAGTAVEDRFVVQLAPGPHTIEVRKNGYRAYRTEVTVKGNTSTPLNVSLTKEP